MDLRSEIIDHKGIKAVGLYAGRYQAVVANSLGSNVLRFRDNENDIEVFRYGDAVSIAEIMNSAEVWGLPALYLPNRFDGGILRTSDRIYHLPENEDKFGNHIHGFIHRRAHRIKDMGVSDGKAFVHTEFNYDESDFFFSCFPVKFRAEILIELSEEEGLRQTITLTNRSDVMMPVSVATHTTYNAPFVKDAKQEDIRLTVPAEKRLPFNKRRWLPTGRMIPLTQRDKLYVSGEKCPVLTDICNDMYLSGAALLDGKPFRGVIMTDTASGKSICNEVDENYKFWIIWNDKGFKDYFCVEPMTAQVNAPNLDMPAEMSGYTELKPGGKYSVSQRFFTKR